LALGLQQFSSHNAALFHAHSQLLSVSRLPDGCLGHLRVSLLQLPSQIIGLQDVRLHYCIVSVGVLLTMYRRFLGVSLQFVQRPLAICQLLPGLSDDCLKLADAVCV
jgi:hypothetical protein